MRLDELTEQEGDAITIEWKSFLLRPQPEQRSLAEFTEYTKSWGRPAGLEPKAEFNSPWSGSSPSTLALSTGRDSKQNGGDIWSRNLAAIPQQTVAGLLHRKPRRFKF